MSALVLTFDLLFPDEARFTHAAAVADQLRTEVARRYGEQLDRVTVHVYRPALAIKISFPPPC